MHIAMLDQGHVKAKLNTYRLSPRLLWKPFSLAVAKASTESNSAEVKWLAQQHCNSPDFAKPDPLSGDAHKVTRKGLPRVHRNVIFGHAIYQRLGYWQAEVIEKQYWVPVCVIR
jgi:hypothetical protein